MRWRPSSRPTWTGNLTLQPSVSACSASLAPSQSCTSEQVTSIFLQNPAVQQLEVRVASTITLLTGLHVYR